MSATHDIFISYSRQDAEIVNKVCKELVSAGFSLWIDKNGIESGDAFKSIIVKAIEGCNTLLFFSSQSSNKSYWTTKEISIAIYEGKTIIPIKLDDSKYNSEIKFDLINLDYIDLTNLSFVEDGINRLIRALRNRQFTDIEINNVSNEKISEEIDRKPNLKFLFQYKGCIVSLTLCLIGIIVIPFLFITNKTVTSSSVSNSISEELIACSRSNRSGPDFEMKYCKLLMDESFMFSEEGFVIEINYYADYTFVVHDTVLADSVDMHYSDYIEINEPPYIKYMEAGVEYIQNKSFEDAYNQFLKAANLGCSDAMYNVSISHLTGIGAEIDTLKAIKWLQKASDLNNRHATNKLNALNN